MPTSTKRKPVPTTRTNEILPLAPLGALAVALLGLSGAAKPLIYVARDMRRLESLAAALQALAPACSVAVFPEWDCLPCDRASPSRGVMGSRTGVLRWLTDANNLPNFVLTTAPALIQRVPPLETWARARLEVRVGDELQADQTITALQRLGYILDDRVDEPGEVAIRGRVLDLFPAAASRPCRIELDDVHVTAIRSYDPVSQRSATDVDVLIVDPATEIILAPNASETLRPFTGQEHELPRFYPELVSLLDYVPEAGLVIEDGAEARADAFFEQIADGRDSAVRLSGENARAGRAAAERLYQMPQEWIDLVARKQLALTEEHESIAVPVFARERRPGAAFARYLRERQDAGDRILIASPKHSLRHLAREAVSVLGHKLQRASSWAAVLKAEPGRVLAMEAPLEDGFRVPDVGVTVLTAADLLGHQAGVTAGGRTVTLPMGEVDLRLGDVAIHSDHGLCIFEGLEPVRGPDGQVEDAVRLRFADEAVLMVPASQADRIWRYGSEADAVSLDRLERSTWQKRRAGVEDAVRRTAQIMLEVAEARRQASADVLVSPTREMERFAAGFGFALTPDQASAIEAVLSDPAAGHPMSRRVCGDVGVGKSEVALRAAAAALFAGKQVAIAAPTTVLARQHV